jgi:hypothetical protein
MGPSSDSPREGGSPDNRPAVHVLISTHTTRHLAACLAALAWQREVPESVVVSCDTDDPAIGLVMDVWWPRIAATLERRGQRAPMLLHTFRPHQGEARLNQVRNNGLRALDERGVMHERDLVVVIDGDIVLEPSALQHHRAARVLGAEVVVPFRINLTERESLVVTGGSILRQAERPGWDDGPAEAAPVLHRALRRSRPELEARGARYRRQLFWRRLLPFAVKRHKSKILGGHHAVNVRVLRAVNGYDEGYVGYGYDDDDLSRRIHRLRPRARVSIAVEEIIAYHLWHPTRAPARPTEAPGFSRFSRRDLPTRAEHGWGTPAPQPDPTVRVIAAARSPDPARA